ncbi:homeobox protein zampogna-like [Stylophora pistillata]|uniref:T-cell leukemia homeobox protein 1 n=1 Tax=Stylophora pistillata TaxID=50429 RepID=A0A2B4RJZ7_STYPI|nr:homeobox protein zampogna-like [Stylophora pistillata]PFX18724.1 T-cell leukemia homeobox protein 1 [Stylophora pistillata]
MDLSEQKTSLSFSIENILREDFAHRRRPNFVNFSTRGELDYERWPSSPFYQCCSVRFLSPGFVKCLPNIHRVEDRLQRPNAATENLSLEEEKKSLEEDSLGCKEKVILQENDERCEKDSGRRSKSGKCIEKGVKPRKRRNRSHFTQRQLQYLDKIFSRQQYLTRDERTLLARGLEMTELQIRNWFQNRRYQKRHRGQEEKKQVEQEMSVA